MRLATHLVRSACVICAFKSWSDANNYFQHPARNVFENLIFTASAERPKRAAATQRRNKAVPPPRHLHRRREGRSGARSCRSKKTLRLHFVTNSFFMIFGFRFTKVTDFWYVPEQVNFKGVAFLHCSTKAAQNQLLTRGVA
jgi:hypothetical protein